MTTRVILALMATSLLSAGLAQAVEDAGPAIAQPRAGWASRPGMAARHGMGRRHRPLSGEQEKELLAYLKRERPDEYKKLLATKKGNPLHYRMNLHRWWSWYQTPKDVRKARADLYEIGKEIWQIRQALQDTKESSAREELVDKLTETVTRKFDADQVMLQHRLTHLETQIQGHQAELQRRARERKAIIAEEVKRYLAGPAQSPGPHGPQGPQGPPRGGPPPSADAPHRVRAPDRHGDSPRRRSRWGRFQPPTAKLSAKQVEELLGKLKQNLPLVHKWLADQKEQGQDQRRRWALAYYWEFYQRIDPLLKPVREAHIRRHECRLVIWQIRKTLDKTPDTPRREELSKKLAQRVEQRFEADQIVQQARLNEFKRQLKIFRQEFARRKAGRDALIAEEVKRIQDEPLPTFHRPGRSGNGGDRHRPGAKKPAPSRQDPRAD